MNSTVSLHTVPMFLNQKMMFGICASAEITQSQWEEQDFCEAVKNSSHNSSDTLKMMWMRRSAKLKAYLKKESFFFYFYGQAKGLQMFELCNKHAQTEMVIWKF